MPEYNRPPELEIMYENPEWGSALEQFRGMIAQAIAGRTFECNYRGHGESQPSLRTITFISGRELPGSSGVAYTEEGRQLSVQLESLAAMSPELQQIVTQAIEGLKISGELKAQLKKKFL